MKICRLWSFIYEIVPSCMKYLWKVGVSSSIRGNTNSQNWRHCWAYFRSEVFCWTFQFPLTDISLLVIVGFKVNIVHILVNTLTCIFCLIKLIYFNMHIETLVGFLFIACFNKVILSPPPCGWSWFSGLYNANYLHRSFFHQTYLKFHPYVKETK